VGSQELFYATRITSPLDQFDIRNLISFDVLGNINLGITNIGLYLTIGALIILTLNILATNYNRIGSNNWSIGNESLYSTIHSIVVNQINEIRGQIYFPFIYTLFVFILVNNLIGMVKAMCLFPTKFLFIRQVPSQKVSFSSSSCYSNGLHPYFLTGFTDGEGCFHISIYKDSRAITGWHVKPVFKITLHQKDRALLELIRASLGVGQISKHGNDSIQLRVSSVKDLQVIIDHFDKYPLVTQKLADYLLFKRVFELIKRKEHLTHEGLRRSH